MALTTVWKFIRSNRPEWTTNLTAEHWELLDICDSLNAQLFDPGFAGTFTLRTKYRLWLQDCRAKGLISAVELEQIL